MRNWGTLTSPLIAVLTACTSTLPSSLPASPSSSAQTENRTFVVSGTVTETVNGVSRPVPDIRVDVYVNGTCGLPAGGPNCRVERSDVVRTNQDGRYVLEQVPKTRVFVFAQYPGSQPCVASAAVENDTTIDVQVVPLGPSLPPSPGSPMIGGLVYETTPQGRRALPAADVGLEVGFGDSWPIARTRADDAGRFTLCQMNTAPRQWELVNPNVRMLVVSSGYQRFERTLNPVVSDSTLDIELQRGEK